MSEAQAPEAPATPSAPQTPSSMSAVIARVSRCLKHIATEPLSLPGGLKSIEHIFTLPLNWKEPQNGEEVKVFVREVNYFFDIFRTNHILTCQVFNARTERSSLPYLMYFQVQKTVFEFCKTKCCKGGPGFPSAPPPCPSSGWVKRALDDYRVLLLDQRGTGRSTAVTTSALMKLPNAEARAAYLQNFRADSIVEDAEVATRRKKSHPQ